MYQHQRNEIFSMASLQDDWTRLKTKFRMRFGDKVYHELMATAQLDVNTTNDSLLYFSVVGNQAAIRLISDDFLPSLKQIWQSVTGRFVNVQVVARSDSAIVTKIEEKQETKPRLSINMVAFRQLEGEEREQFIADFLQEHRSITVKACQHLVAGLNGLKVSVMLESGRAREPVRLRSIAMYLSRKLALKSLPEIGRKFDDRDHSTVLHAIRKMEKLSSRDDELKAEIEEYMGILKQLGQ